jgi:hypothetical protein
MARPLSELQAILKGLDGVEDAYIQAPTTGMKYPCIVIERDAPTNVSFADNVKYVLKKAYSVIVVDRDPQSLIPDYVEGLPHSRFERYYRADGLHHFAFQLFF